MSDTETPIVTEEERLTTRRPAGPQSIATLDPQALISKALESGAAVETMEKLVDLAVRIREVQAREAYSAAVVAFQGECGPIIKDRKASIRTKGGGAYTYSYASLDGVMDAVQPVAGKYGLSITWKTRTTATHAHAKCVLRHAMGHAEDGDEIAIPIEQAQEGGSGASPAQRVGIALSYAKRYAALAALGLAPTEATDGTARGMEDQHAPPPEEPTGQVTTISEGQGKRFWAIAREHGWKESEVKALLDRHGVASTKEIPTGNYEMLCTALKGGA